ncbi:hypothetical protein [Streptomyces luteolus]|uniref:Uncharacterized protein n=1 Tax=Streptomyces luteolus TaxID=3043615 RepID=A0ABT6SPT9_9ACTN|nr:hypothetical protein [Streptomyces sp. B-S-A12]MDI3417621.1 hypothetical protein [Streptomyces sp. B-S-A12]
MTKDEFRLLIEQARAEARRTVLVPRAVSAGDRYAARARHAEFGAGAH